MIAGIGVNMFIENLAIQTIGSSVKPLLLTEEVTNRRTDKKKAPVCPECGGTDIDILSGEGVAVCNGCHLEWPYVED